MLPVETSGTTAESSVITSIVPLPMIRPQGLEPRTSRTQTGRAARLRYRRLKLTELGSNQRQPRLVKPTTDTPRTLLKITEDTA